MKNKKQHSKKINILIIIGNFSNEQFGGLILGSIFFKILSKDIEATGSSKRSDKGTEHINP